MLDADKSGFIDLEDIKMNYNAKGHKEVVAGYKTEEEVLRELLDNFDGGESRRRRSMAWTLRSSSPTMPTSVPAWTATTTSAHGAQRVAHQRW